MRPFMLRMWWCVVVSVGLVVQAERHNVSDGATVRIQSSQFGPSWREGKVQIAKEGCAFVRKPDSKVSGGRTGLGLMFIQKLERQDGTKWIDVPVAPMMKNEPRHCQEGAE